MLIVKDKDLEKVENEMDLITSKHIFSVQKCTELADLNVLYSAQKEGITSSFNGISGITFNCKQRDNSLIEELKHKALPVLSKKPSIMNTKKPQPQNNAQVSDTKKTGGTYNLFGKQKPKSVSDKEDGAEKADKEENKNNEASKVEKETIPSKNVKKPSITTKTGSIGAFFNKAEPKSAHITKKSTEKEDECKNKELKDAKKQSPLKENKPTLNINQEKETLKRSSETIEVEVKSKKLKKTSNAKGKKKTQKKSSKDTKKRNRLMVLSDSESESDGEENEVEREPTPEPQATVIMDDEDIICGTPEPTKKRKKKLVSKTFMSADGFMETQKVYESFSDEEEEEKMPEKKMKTAHESSDVVTLINEKEPDPSKKIETQQQNPPKTTQSPQKTKQASLMSFFKKK